VARRLPVLQTPKSGEDAEARARPAWQWVLITATLTLTSFLPLALLGTWAGSRIALGTSAQTGALWGALPVLAAFAIAAGFGGALLGRFSDRAGPRAATLGGALGGAFLFAIALLGRALSPWPVALAAGAVLVAGGGVFAALGARLGRPRNALR
jgi:hypothetical protein